MLTQAEQRQLEQRMQKRQVKEFMGVRSILTTLSMPSHGQFYSHAILA
jgi:hypothetical protein